MRAETVRLVGQCLLLCPALGGCKDADTVIAIWAPAGANATGGGDASGAIDSSSEPPTPMTPPVDAAAQPAAFYLEAEQGQLSDGWIVASTPPPSGMAASDSYIEASEDAPDNNAPGLARATYDFTLGIAGEYVIWGRIHSPGAIRNRFWFRVDEQAWFLWRISTGDVWFWDDFHNNTAYTSALVFSLEAGPHRLEIANAVTEAQLDQLYLTSMGDVPPGNTTPCSPPHSIELAGACISSCGSHGVNVTCGAAICATREALEAYDCAVCCLQ